MKRQLLARILREIRKLGGKMSALSDAIQVIADKQTAEEAAWVTFKTDLEKAIADLAAKVAAGSGVAQADLDALTALGGRIDSQTGNLTAEDVTVKQADQ